LNKSIKIIINWVIAPLLAAWLFYSLYKQLQAQPQLHESIALIKQMPFGRNAWKFWLVIGLAFVNWSYEARKWQLLLKSIQPIRFFTAVKSVLCGVALSLNTPNRIGEYGGRILFVKEGNRIKAVPLSIVGSMSQLIITLLMGCGGLLYIIVALKNEGTVMGLSIFWIKIFLYFSVVVVVVFLLLFFKLSWIIRMIEKIPYANKYVKYVSVLDHFEVKILLRLLSLSFCRYLVFVLQYIFMLQLLQVKIDWWQGFWVITLLFWVLAIVPSFAIADLGIRGKFAVALFTLFSNNVVGIIGTTFGIWFINLFMPAIVGSVLILGIKVFKET
jgi:hypothetical protein